MLYFVIGSVIAVIIWWCVVYIKYEIYLRKFSGPTPIPIIGSVHHIGHKTNILPSLSKLIDKHGEPLKLMFGFSPRLVLADAKSVEFLLSSNKILNKSYDYHYFHNWLGMGLLTSYGRRWKNHRRLLTPAFHFKILEHFIEVFDKQSNILIKKLNGLNADEAVNIYPYVTLHALDVICEATMNTSIGAQLNSNHSYVKSVKEICRILIERGLSLKMWDFAYRFSKDYHKEKKALRILHDLSTTVVKRRKQELEELKLYKNGSNSNETTKRVPFLDLLLTSTVSGYPLSDHAIREEVDTFMFEGHDTTTSGISFTLYCLSKHQEIQNKVFEEITSILSSGDNSLLSYEKLQKMKYLEQVIKEAFRIYPPVPIIARALQEDAFFGGKIIPKNVTLVVSIYNLHHNPTLFPNPEVFDPERFNFESSKKISLYSYIPFSAGPRNCIGQKFAMLEVKATVCKIIQAFKLLPVFEHEPRLIANATLISENGLPILCRKRKEKNI